MFLTRSRRRARLTEGAQEHDLKEDLTVLSMGSDSPFIRKFGRQTEGAASSAGDMTGIGKALVLSNFPRLFPFLGM